MSTDLEQLFRESASGVPASQIDLDAVVHRGRRARRRLQVRTAASVGVTSALVVGVGALATTSAGVAGPGPTADSGALGGPTSMTLTASAEPPLATPSPTAPIAGPTPPVPTPSASPSSGSAAATPATTSYPPAPKPVSSEAPAALRVVTLPDPAPGFGARRFPDSVGLENLYPLTSAYWTATFGVGDPTGAGKQATVFVGEFPMPPTSGTPTLGSSPGPITDTPTVAGHQAYVTHDGTQTILYFRTARFTVQVCGWHAGVADLVALAESLRGIE
jgi:hypothetical protein